MTERIIYRKEYQEHGVLMAFTDWYLSKEDLETEQPLDKDWLIVEANLRVKE